MVMNKWCTLGTNLNQQLKDKQTILRHLHLHVCEISKLDQHQPLMTAAATVHPPTACMCSLPGNCPPFWRTLLGKIYLGVAGDSPSTFLCSCSSAWIVVLTSQWADWMYHSCHQMKKIFAPSERRILWPGVWRSKVHYGSELRWCVCSELAVSGRKREPALASALPPWKLIKWNWNKDRYLALSTLLAQIRSARSVVV